MFNVTLVSNDDRDDESTQIDSREMCVCLAQTFFGMDHANHMIVSSNKNDHGYVCETWQAVADAVYSK